ncbi:hypothetical protein ElyMa_002543800, partial [Elysia marginata]
RHQQEQHHYQQDQQQEEETEEKIESNILAKDVLLDIQKIIGVPADNDPNVPFNKNKACHVVHQLVQNINEQQQPCDAEIPQMDNSCGMSEEEFEHVLDLMSVNSFTFSQTGDEFLKLITQVYRTIHAKFMSKIYKTVYGDGARFLFSLTQLLTKLLTIRSKAQVSENAAYLNFIAQIQENDLQFKHNNTIPTKSFVNLMETSMAELKKELRAYAGNYLEDCSTKYTRKNMPLIQDLIAANMDIIQDALMTNDTRVCEFVHMTEMEYAVIENITTALPDSKIIYHQDNRYFTNFMLINVIKCIARCYNSCVEIQTKQHKAALDNPTGGTSKKCVPKRRRKMRSHPPQSMYQAQPVLYNNNTANNMYNPNCERMHQM